MTGKTLLAMLLCLLLTTPTSSQCTDGCLLCEKIDANSSKCSICDSFASYVPFGVGLCFKLEVENCLIPTTDRSVTKCLACKDGTIYDTTTHKCKEVAKTIGNCLKYDSVAGCMMCNQGYYLSGGDCQQVPATIENCGVYNSDASQCLSCAAGYYSNPFDGKCVNITGATNCLAYTRASCQKCTSGYVINNNLTLNKPITHSVLQQFVSALVAKTQLKTELIIDLPVDNCQKGIVANCAVHEFADKCLTCAVGYLKTEDGKDCHRFPEEPVANCQVYSTATSCLTCVNGAYRDTNNNCVSSTVVANCFIYSQALNKCQQCEYGFYLNTNACVKRVNSLNVVQCQVYNPSLDECQTCNPNFLLKTPSNYVCVTGVVNCLTHTISGETATCTHCKAGYGLNGQTCQGLSTDFCLTYVGQTSVCQECNAEYYVDATTKKCLPNTALHCQTKHKNLNSCVTCISKFWSDNGVCKVQNILNCVSYNSNLLTCATCAFGYYVNAGLSSTCTSSTAKFCTAYNSNDDSCDTCAAGYYPDSANADKCVVQSKTGCNTYNVNTNICNLCHDNHFPDPDAATECKPQAGAVLNCSKYTAQTNHCIECNLGWFASNNICNVFNNPGCASQTFNLNKCTTCSLNYYRDSNQECQALGVVNCIKNDVAGPSQVCEQCSVATLLFSVTSCTNRVSTIPRDPTCTGNKNKIDNGSCTVCPANQTAFFADKYDASSLRSGCKSFSTSAAGTCLQCASGFGSSTSATGNLCNTSSNTDNCILKTTAGVGELLSVAGKCEKCREEDKMYLAATGSGTCTSRLMKDRMNCATGKGALSTCAKCGEGSAYAQIDKFVTCAPVLSTETPAGTIATTHCDAWTESLAECRACKLKKGDDCNTALSTTNGTFANFLDKDFEVTAWKEGSAAMSTGCAASNGYGPFMAADGGTADIGCVSCAATFFKVLSTYATTTYTFASLSYEKGAKHPFPETIVSRTACHANTGGNANSYAGFVKDYTPEVVNTHPTPNVPEAPKVLTSTLTNVSDVMNTKNGIIAARCKKTFRPVWFQIEYSAADVRLDDATKRGFYDSTVDNCTADPGTFVSPIKRYTGLQYGFSAVNGVNLNALLYYDSCVLLTDLFVFVAKQEGTSKEIFFSKIGSGDTHELCVVPTIADGTAHTIVANCQIHLHLATDNVFTAAQTLKCLSCKPGYKATYTGATDKIITACVAITNCDRSNEASNTWMNGCEKCMDDYAWKIDKTTFIPDYTVCDATTRKNCLFEESGGTKCVFCEPGYLADADGECIAWEISNCATLGMPPLKQIRADYSITANTVQGYNQMAAFFNFQYIGDANKDKFYAKSGCLECAASFYRLTSDSTTLKYCSGSTANVLFTAQLIANCVKYNTSATKTCAECKTGMFYNEATVACEAQTTPTVNCLSVNAGNCTVCKSGHAPQSNKCPGYDNCGDVQGGICVRCNDLYKPKTGAEDHDCVPRNSTDICKSYDNKNVCLQCDDAAKSPVTFVDSTSKGYRSVCITKYHDLVGGASKDALAASTSYIIKSDATTFETQLKSYKVYNPAKTYSVEAVFMESFYGSVCVTAPTTPNCKTHGATHECTLCMPGYILEPNTKECDEGTVSNCSTYNVAGDSCTGCQTDFFLSGSGTAAVCKPRFIQNCLTYIATNDKCASCLADNYFTVTSVLEGTCTPYTVTDCKTKNNTADECTACDTDVRYLDATSGNKCRLYSKQFCKEYSTSEDKCTDCYDNRFLNGTTFECEEYTVTNCSGVKNTTLDQCTGCENYFYLAGGKCLAPTTTNCLALNATIDKCTTCDIGYWKNPSEKCELNSALNCLVKATDSNKCTSCLNIHYMDTDNVCKPHNSANCDTYHGTKSQCATCVTGFYLKIDGVVTTCVPNGSAHCTVKSKLADDCLTCNSAFYLDSTTKQCVNVTNVTCLALTSNTNNCATCVTNKYIDSTTKQCAAVTTVPFCASYSLNADTCGTCKTGYYKSASATTCIVNPDGIPGCVRYSNLTTCDACKSTHYLNENKCVLFDAATETVVNCKEYSGVKICSACEALYSVDTNSCQANAATGCAIWADKDNCSTCPANSVLAANAPKNCSVTTISGCDVVTGTVGSETCTQCSSTTFLKENKCEALTKSVVGCLVYASDGICSRCPDSQALSADGKACAAINNSLLGAMCTRGTLGDSPRCAICDEGFLMNSDRICTNECKVENCMICNPMDSAKCNLCKTNFHMNSDLKCLQNNQRTTTTSIGRLSGVLWVMGMVWMMGVFGNDW